MSLRCPNCGVYNDGRFTCRFCGVALPRQPVTSETDPVPERRARTRSRPSLSRTVILILPLGIMSAGSSVIQVSYALALVPPSQLAVSLFGAGFWLFGMIWLAQDCKLRNRAPCFDYGLILGILHPLSLLWYAFWSRGIKGIGVAAVLVGLYLAPVFLAAFAWAVALSMRR